MQPLYGSLALPVLVAWGVEDTWIPIDRAHALAEAIPGARLQLVRDAGHLIQVDAPERLATVLHGWLVEQRQRPGLSEATALPQPNPLPVLQLSGMKWWSESLSEWRTTLLHPAFIRSWPVGGVLRPSTRRTR